VTKAKEGYMADGGHIYGNFHDYYEFNPENERLRFLTHELRAALRNEYFYSKTSLPDQPSNVPVTILDVGCNEGK